MLLSDPVLRLVLRSEVPLRRVASPPVADAARVSFLPPSRDGRGHFGGVSFWVSRQGEGLAVALAGQACFAVQCSISSTPNIRFLFATGEIIAQHAGQVNNIGKKKDVSGTQPARNDEVRLDQSDDCSEGDFFE